MKCNLGLLDSRLGSSVARAPGVELFAWEGSGFESHSGHFFVSIHNSVWSLPDSDSPEIFFLKTKLTQAHETLSINMQIINYMMYSLNSLHVFYQANATASDD